MIDKLPSPGSAPGKSSSTTPYRTDFLPSVDSLARPDELFSRPPYHLVVNDLGRQKIEIQSSHTKSLQLLSGYLQRWCRINHNDTRNVRVSPHPLQQHVCIYTSIRQVDQ